jgi:PAS domain S-box-containing protein
VNTAANVTDEGYEVEYRIVRPDGDVRHVHEITNPERDDAGVTVRRVGTFQDITERKQVEEALRDREAQLSHGASLARLGYWVWDNVEDRCVFCSDELARIYGSSSPEEFLAVCGSRAEEVKLLHPDDRARVVETIQQADAARTDFDIEYRIVRRDGETRHVHANSELVLDNNGDIIRSNGILQDITERKQAQAALRESDAALEEAQRIAKIGNWRWSIPRNELISCSAEYARIHGVDPDQIDGHMERQLKTVIHADDRARVEEQFRRIGEAGTDFEIEYRIVRPDREVRHVLETGRVVVDDAGRPVEHVGTVQDVTERKRVEEALRANEQRLGESARLARLSYMVWSFTEDRCTSCSDVYAEVHGVTVEEFMARASSKGAAFGHPDDLQNIRAAEDEVLTGSTKEIEYRLVIPSGETRYVHAIIRPIFSESGTVVGEHEVVQDITRITEAEDHLRQAQKMEAVGQLTAGVAHNFNNILAVISGNTELLGELLESDMENTTRSGAALLRSLPRSAAPHL